MNDFILKKMRYIDQWNFHTKHSLVIQQSTLMFAKDSHILHYFNLLIHSPKIIFAIM